MRTAFNFQQRHGEAYLPSLLAQGLVRHALKVLTQVEARRACCHALLLRAERCQEVVHVPGTITCSFGASPVKVALKALLPLGHQRLPQPGPNPSP
eukprot:9274753-Pyramimonas_sp.AAC.1